MAPYTSIPDQPDTLIESIVAITEQRDQHSLELSLCTSLREILQTPVLAIIDLPATGPGQASLGELPGAVLEAARNLQADEFRNVYTPGMGYQLGWLIGEPGQVSRILAVGLPVWDATRERLVVGMVRVFQNFVRLLHDSERDTLTGLHNRRRLERQLEGLLAARLSGRRRGEDEGGDYVAIIDLDKFKGINDTHGHLIGDEVLLIFANLLRESVREFDRCYRYGGEEFIVVLNKVDDTQAAMVLERLRARVAAHAFPQVGQVTVSIGYTLVAQQTLPPQILEEADRALYFAKEHGRNQVHDYRALVESNAIDARKTRSSVEIF